MLINVNSSTNSKLSQQKILITGADGMLGRAFQAMLALHYPSASVHATKHEDLDVTDLETVLRHVTNRYNFIIHCAADVNADRCEAFPEQCHQIQVQGTLNVLKLAAESNAKIFYPQSFLIFPGGEDPINESTVPEPKSVYGRCKLEAEMHVLSSSPERLVVRMAGFFGGDEKDKNFVGKFTRHLAELLRQGTRTYAVGDRIWQPTYTEDLARNSLLLLDQGQQGVWSMGSVGEASFFDLAQECVRQLGLENRIEIVPALQSAISASDVARRPDRAVMSNERLLSSGLCLQRPWKESLKEYLSRPWFKSLFSNI
jgi:dTDP-4-dehydrorhamnose reductase